MADRGSYRGFARGQVLYYGLEILHEVQFTIFKKPDTEGGHCQVIKLH